MRPRTSSPEPAGFRRAGRSTASSGSTSASDASTCSRGTGPATLERVGRMFDVATPGIDLAIYIGSRVQGIVRRSLFERAGDPPRLPPLPLPPQGPGIPWIALL